jgi:predicted glycosyl hydrolase (DUF1957 family)
MSKEDEIMNFLHKNVFDPILSSPIASSRLKQGVRLTITRMRQRDALGMMSYYWSAIIGTDRSTRFANEMRQEGFTRFEETIDEFRERFR